MNLIVSTAILVLQRVPFVNRIPAIADPHNIDRALSAVSKAAQRLENVHTHQLEAAAEARKVAAAAQAAADEYQAVADRAKRIAGRVGDFLA